MNFRDMSNESKEGRPRQSPVAGNTFLLPTGLARQSSVYSLTFDEFQNSLGGVGKDFGSMNMDELLKNIWTAEEAQAMASATAMGMPEVRGSGLGRQGSLTLPRTLSQKTVDEVWRDLLRETSGSGAAEPANTTRLIPPQQRQPTLGEMTLEEFLVRAGVVREDINQSSKNVPVASTNINNTNNASKNVFFGDFSGANSNSNMGLGLGFPMNGANMGMTASQPLLSNSAAINEGGASFAPTTQLGNSIDTGNQSATGVGIAGISTPTMNNGMVPGPIGMAVCGIAPGATGSPMKLLPCDGFGRNNGDLSSLSPVPYMFNRGLGKKCSGVEKVVERRQRRMIKNRESAARSRARKQAYTMELEEEVAKLKEQNQELQKKQAEILEIQKNQVLEKINRESKLKRVCLRRALTGPW